MEGSDGGEGVARFRKGNVSCCLQEATKLPRTTTVMAGGVTTMCWGCLSATTTPNLSLLVVGLTELQPALCFRRQTNCGGHLDSS